MTAFSGSIPTIASGDTTTVPTNLAIYRDALKALTEARTSYVPSWTATTTNPVIGNGTITGRYAQAGKFTWFAVRITVGSTTTVGSGIYQISLPVIPLAADPMHFDLMFTDLSAAQSYWGTTQFVSGSKVNLLYDASTAGGALSGLTNAAPVVPATGDIYDISGWYEGA